MKPTNDQIAHYLEQFNLWRRGWDDSYTQPHPKELGEMIDLAVERLRENNLK